MNTAPGVIELERKTGLKGRIFSFFGGYWAALQEWRRREKLRADLSYLNDFELNDIGITRGEIDYVVSNCSIDPRGIRSAGPMNV
jgi:uncharacterized protein YjiS (DUF1127 family)